MSTKYPMRLFCEAAHEASKSKGWWDDNPGPMSPDLIASKLCLIHSEVSEALEEVRTGNDLGHVYEGKAGKPEGFLIEIADVMIRIGDLVAKAGLSAELEEAIALKMEFNESRPHRHGGKAM